MPINPYRLAELKSRVLRGCGWLVLLLVVLVGGFLLLVMLLEH